MSCQDQSHITIIRSIRIIRLIRVIRVRQLLLQFSELLSVFGTSQRHVSCSVWLQRQSTLHEAPELNESGGFAQESLSQTLLLWIQNVVQSLDRAQHVQLRSAIALARGFL